MLGMLEWFSRSREHSSFSSGRFFVILFSLGLSFSMSACNSSKKIEVFEPRGNIDLAYSSCDNYLKPFSRNNIKWTEEEIRAYWFLFLTQTKDVGRKMYSFYGCYAIVLNELSRKFANRDYETRLLKLSQHLAVSVVRRDGIIPNENLGTIIESGGRYDLPRKILIIAQKDAIDVNNRIARIIEESDIFISKNSLNECLVSKGLSIDCVEGIKSQDSTHSFSRILLQIEDVHKKIDPFY